MINFMLHFAISGGMIVENIESCDLYWDDLGELLSCWEFNLPYRFFT